MRPLEIDQPYFLGLWCTNREKRPYHHNKHETAQKKNYASFVMAIHGPLSPQMVVSSGFDRWTIRVPEKILLRHYWPIFRDLRSEGLTLKSENYGSEIFVFLGDRAYHMGGYYTPSWWSFFTFLALAAGSVLTRCARKSTVVVGLVGGRRVTVDLGHLRRPSVGSWRFPPPQFGYMPPPKYFSSPHNHST